jgi:putative chitinase
MEVYMCISNSVGIKGSNTSLDVKTIQLVLNMNIGRLIPYLPLAVNGVINKHMTDMIGEFQRRVMKQDKPDGRINPNGATLNKLRQGIPAEFSQEKLQAIMIRAKSTHIAKYFLPLQLKMSDYEINTSLRKAHFLAQLAHESMEFIYSEEIASGAAYEGRKDLGNTQKGDGVRFKGRGLIQITGRTNYTNYGKYRGKDYLTGDNPKLLSTDPETAVDCSCWFWKTRKLNELADIDDVRAITKKINGGLNGFEDRKQKLARAKYFLVA